MKNKILLLIALIITATQAYAGNGDLIVDGKAGIGTTSPTSYLAGTSGITVYNAVYPGVSIANASNYWVWYMNGNDLRLYEPNNDRVTFQKGGNVGVGTITPTSYLAGTSGLTVYSSGYPGVSLANATNYWLWYMSGDDLKLYGPTVGDLATFKKNGTYQFTIQGNAYASGGVWQDSDERYKKNIMPVRNAADTLLKIEGVSYEWVKSEKIPGTKTESVLDKESIAEEKNFPNGRHYGVLAQAIEKVLPEVVNTDSKGYKAVNYAGIIPILIEAIKEQQKRIDLLEKKLSELQ